MFVRSHCFRSIKTTICLLCLALSQVSCLNLGATPSHDIKNYQLQATAIAPIAIPKTAKTLAVKEGFIAPANRGLSMVYQLNAYQVNYFVESRWQTLPSSMITAALSEALQNSGLFTAVVLTPPFVGPIDQTVTVNLLELRQVFDATKQHSVIHLRVQLVVTNGVTGKLEAVNNFSAHVPSDPNPIAGVKAANQALQHVLPEMITLIAHTNG